MSDVIRNIAFNPARPARPARAAWTIARIWSAVTRAMEVAGSRRQLAEADDRTLQDLGISRAQARFEASRAPWQIGAR